MGIVLILVECYFSIHLGTKVFDIVQHLGISSIHPFKNLIHMTKVSKLDISKHTGVCKFVTPLSQMFGIATSHNNGLLTHVRVDGRLATSEYVNESIMCL